MRAQHVLVTIYDKYHDTYGSRKDLLPGAYRGCSPEGGEYRQLGYIRIIIHIVPSQLVTVISHKVLGVCYQLL